MCGLQLHLRRSGMSLLLLCLRLLLRLHLLLLLLLELVLLLLLLQQELLFGGVAREGMARGRLAWRCVVAVRIGGGGLRVLLLLLCLRCGLRGLLLLVRVPLLLLLLLRQRRSLLRRCVRMLLLLLLRLLVRGHHLLPRGLLLRVRVRADESDAGVRHKLASLRVVIGAGGEELRVRVTAHYANAADHHRLLLGLLSGHGGCLLRGSLLVQQCLLLLEQCVLLLRCHLHGADRDAICIDQRGHLVGVHVH